jgi:tetratricopeptide (TPR) repeat protein
LKQATVFMSYKFADADAEYLFNFVKQIVANLRRILIVDGKSLGLLDGFSGGISSFIRESATCVVALLTRGPHGNANVLFEIGVGVGADKPVVIVADGMEIVPAMLRHRHVHTFQRSDLNWQEELKNRLEQQLREILLVPPDDMVEDKLKRRYADETTYFRDASKLQTPIAAIKQGDLSKAEAILRNMQRHPHHQTDVLFLLADASYLRGVASEDPLEREQCFKRQIEIARSSLALDGENVLGFSALAAGQLRLGFFEEARETLLTLVRLAAGFSVAHYNLACCAALMSEKGEMLRWLQSAIACKAAWRDFSKGDKDFAAYWADLDWRSLVY